MSSSKSSHPCLLISKLPELEEARRTAVRATDNAADEPKPEPRGSSDLITTVAGLNLTEHPEAKIEG